MKNIVNERCVYRLYTLYILYGKIVHTYQIVINSKYKCFWSINSFYFIFLGIGYSKNNNNSQKNNNKNKKKRNNMCKYHKGVTRPMQVS